jgi:putative membrane protein
MKQTIILLFILLAGILQAQRDEKFLQEAAMNNLLEIKLGELATRNGYSDTIRVLARQMVKDHTDANADLLEVALKKNLAFPMALGEKEQAIYDKLVLKNAEEFDKAYAKLMVKYHKKDITKHKNESKKGKDEAIRQYATNLLPMVQRHYETAKATRSYVKNKKK